MSWDKRIGSIHYFGPMPIDIDSPPAVGDHAGLTKLGHKFHVEITKISGDSFTGIVRRIIGQAPALEAAGVHRGDTVTFSEGNIQELHRQGGA